MVFTPVRVLDAWLAGGKITKHQLTKKRLELIISFVDFYNLMFAVFATKEEQIVWLRGKNTNFNNLTPIEFISQNSINIFKVMDLLYRLAKT